MPGFLCIFGHFHIAEHSNAPCPVCCYPAAHRLEHPEVSGALTYPTGHFDTTTVEDAAGHPVVVRHDRLAPLPDTPWKRCEEAVWSVLPPKLGRSACFEGHRFPVDLMKAIRASVCCQWSDMEDYRVHRKAGSFLQGFDEASGWVMVEFATRNPDDRQAAVDLLAAAVANHHRQPVMEGACA